MAENIDAPTGKQSQNVSLHFAGHVSIKVEKQSANDFETGNQVELLLPPTETNSTHRASLASHDNSSASNIKKNSNSVFNSLGSPNTDDNYVDYNALFEKLENINPICSNSSNRGFDENGKSVIIKTETSPSINTTSEEPADISRTIGMVSPISEPQTKQASVILEDCMKTSPSKSHENDEHILTLPIDTDDEYNVCDEPDIKPYFQANASFGIENADNSAKNLIESTSQREEKKVTRKRKAKKLTETDRKKHKKVVTQKLPEKKSVEPKKKKKQHKTITTRAREKKPVNEKPTVKESVKKKNAKKVQREKMTTKKKPESKRLAERLQDKTDTVTKRPKRKITKRKPIQSDGESDEEVAFRMATTRKGKSKVQCIFCNKKFNTESAFKVHDAKKLCRKRIRCTQCKDYVCMRDQWDWLFFHMSACCKEWEQQIGHTRSVSIKCPFCDERFYRQFQFFNHLPSHKDENLNEFVYTITEPPKEAETKITTESENNEEIDNNENDSAASEEHTDLPTDSTSELPALDEISEIKTEEDKDDKRLTCVHCGTRFRALYTALRHLTSSDEFEGDCKARRCEYCQIVCPSKKRLDIHMAEEHEGTTHPCTKCNKVFGLKQQLLRHVVTHNPPTLKCKYCGDLKHTKQGLERHILSKHEIPDHERNLQCLLCFKTFRAKHDLQQHHQRVHKPLLDNYGPHPCPECGQLCKTKDNLKRHRERHLETRPHECPECKKRFRTTNTFRCHLETHKNIRNHTCEVCGNSFKRAHHLRYHMFKHTQERDHVCNICGKAFALKYGLEMHVLRHTGDKPFACTFCDKKFVRKAELNMHVRDRHEASDPKAELKTEVMDE